jgi:eukaryotic-like serine/threonine-protein kinase
MTAAHFLDLLRRSQLLDDEKLAEFLNFTGDGEQLAAAMVKAELLTEWQAEKLLAGKFKGFVLGDYTILSYLRRSGMSQDYVARHNRTKRKVALSVLPVSRVADSTFGSLSQRNESRRIRA